MGIERFAGDRCKLGDRSVTQLEKCVIIVAGLYADYEIEARMLENDPAGLKRADIEHIINN